MSTDLLEPSAPVTTVHTHLRPIDRDGLLKFAEAGRQNPERRGTNKVRFEPYLAGMTPIAFIVRGVSAPPSVPARSPSRCRGCTR